MEEHTASNLSDRELLQYSEESSYVIQKQLSNRLETLLDELDTIEGGVNKLKKKLADIYKKSKRSYT